MKALNLIERNGIFYADSREVAEMTEKEHKHLLRDIQGYLDILGKSNFGPTDFFIESTYMSSQNKTLPCYLITRKGCDMVANKMTGEKGVLFTAAYVTRFEEMEQKFKNPYAAQIPPTYADALRLAADQQETIQQQAAQIEEQRPKVIFANSVETSKASVLIGELAKIIRQNGVNIGRDRLFEWMRTNGYLEKRGENRNLPTQKAMDMGLCEIKKTTINNPDGTNRVTRTPKITGKGQIYFVNLFLKREVKALEGGAAI